MAYHAVYYSIDAVSIGKAAHGSSTSSYFTERPLYDIGGTHLDPVLCRNIQEAEEFIQVPL
jgi:hypothetical protein